MKLNAPLKLATTIIISELAGIIGSFFTVSSIPTWYASIVRPSFAPPNWIFGPVWTTLFALMGVALFLVWQKNSTGQNVRTAVMFFFSQLFLNVLWSVFFFSIHSPGLALIEIVFLWIFILATIVTFFKMSKPAGYLLLPYIAWVSFAAYLNYSIWILN